MRRSAVLLLGMGLAIPAWWLALYQSPSFRGLFVAPEEWGVLQTYLVADLGLALVTAGSAARRVRERMSPAILGVGCGGWGYATAMTCASAWGGRLRPISVVAMLAGLAVVLYASYDLVSTRQSRLD